MRETITTVPFRSDADPQAGWKETTLYSFTGKVDGGAPYAG